MKPDFFKTMRRIGVIAGLVILASPALGDSAKHSEFIITLPRKGYRLIAPVLLVTTADRPLIAMTADRVKLDTAGRPKLRKVPAIGWWLMLSLLLVIGLGFSYWPSMPSQNQPTSFKLTPLTRESGEEVLPIFVFDENISRNQG